MTKPLTMKNFKKGNAAKYAGDSFVTIWAMAVKIPGLVTEAEMKLLYDTIRAERDGISLAVELGCLYGRSTTVIMNALELSTKFYTVDNFAINESDTRPYFIKNIIEKNIGRVTLLDMPAHNAALQYDKWAEGIGFIFVDADHQDHSMLQDCEDWLPKVKPGGIVAFHDYFNADFPSVAKRVEQFTAGWPVVGQADSLIIKRRPL